MITLTVLDEDRMVDVAAEVDGERVLLSHEALAEATGWELKPEGLCRGDLCVPLRERPGPAVDLAVVAGALLRPLALDVEEAVAVLGAPPQAGAGPTQAPDFTLPDLDGRPFTFSSLAGRKRLLFAWASW